MSAGTSTSESRVWGSIVHEAAVAIILCRVAGTPSIAFTVRPEDEERNSCRYGSVKYNTIIDASACFDNLGWFAI